MPYALGRCPLLVEPAGGEDRKSLQSRSRPLSEAITGYVDREMIAVAELKDDMLVLAGTVKFGLGGKDLWQRLYRLRAGPETRSGMIPVRPELVAAVCYFGRYRTGWIRDGVLLRVG